MNQRVHNLSKWLRLDDGDTLRFEGVRARTVVLEVNCPSEVLFFVMQLQEAIEADEERLTDEAAGRPERASNEPRAFLGVAKGRDRFEFAVSGPFELSVEGGEAYIYSMDGLDTATRIEAPEIFTRIANRRQRNPHLEMMEYQMRLNMERRLAELEGESARRVKALEDRLESYAPQRDQRAPAHRTIEAFRRTSDVEADGGEPAGEPLVSDAEVDERPVGRKRGEKLASDEEPGE